MCVFFFFVSSRRRHTRCALVTGVQTCALPIFLPATVKVKAAAANRRVCRPPSGNVVNVPSFGSTRAPATIPRLLPTRSAQRGFWVHRRTADDPGRCATHREGEGRYQRRTVRQERIRKLTRLNPSNKSA